MKLVSNLLLLALVSTLLASKCIKSKTDCKNVICTADYRMINVNLVDASGNHAVVDSVNTIDDAGTVLNTQSEPTLPNLNTYTVVDDSDLSVLKKNTNTTVTFQVFKGGVKVKEEKYIVTADCCHVSKVKGPKSIIVP